MKHASRDPTSTRRRHCLRIAPAALDYRVVRIDEQTAHTADAIRPAQALGLDREVVERSLKQL